MAKIKSKSHTIRIYNCSNQMIPLQIRAPNSDFYSNEQQVRIRPNQDVLLPKSHVRKDQIANLQSKRMIKVVYDSEQQAERETALIS